MMHFDEIKKMKKELETLTESVSELISENSSLKSEVDSLRHDLAQSLRVTGDVLKLHKMIVDTAQFVADKEQIALGDIADLQFSILGR